MHGDDVTEGFILSQLEVAENNNRSCKEISNERPQDFQARFIIGERVLRCSF